MRKVLGKAGVAAIVCAAIALGACTSSKDEILRTGKSAVQLRNMQTRAFDTKDQETTLRTVIATLQDLGFVVDKADEDLGSVSGTKLDGYQLRMTVNVRPRGDSQMLVRANAQYEREAVEDPRPYQQFFDALGQAMFLTAHHVE